MNNMNKQFIYFTGVLFLLTAFVLAVSSQEDAGAVNSFIANNSTSLNNTTINATLNETLNPIASIPAVAPSNETVTEMAILPAEATNETAPDTNETMLAPPEVIPVLEKAPQSNIFAIGGSKTTPPLFSINGQALPQKAYQVGLPAQTIMDLSSLPFFINKV